MFNRKMTNGKKLRKMTNAELADFLIDRENLNVCQYCEYGHLDGHCQAPVTFVCTKGYASALMERWLDTVVVSDLD